MLSTADIADWMAVESRVSEMWSHPREKRNRNILTRCLEDARKLIGVKHFIILATRTRSGCLTAECLPGSRARPEFCSRGMNIGREETLSLSSTANLTTGGRQTCAFQNPFSRRCDDARNPHGSPAGRCPDATLLRPD